MAHDARPIDAVVDARPDAPADAATCAAKPASLAARWRADMNANDSAGTYNGTAQGTVMYTTGKYGDAFSLDGSTSYITINDGDALWPAGSFSISAWINTEYNDGKIISKYECWNACTASVTNAFWGLGLTNGNAEVYLRADASLATITLTDTAHALSDGVWHQVVGVRDSTMSKLILYVDGTVAAAQTLAATDNGAMTNNDGEVDPISIGATGVAAQPSYTPSFHGYLDELAYYSDALTPQQVAAIYSAPQGECP